MIIAEASEHDLQVARAEELLDTGDLAGAAAEAKKVLEELEPTVPTIAHAALTKGKALTMNAMKEMVKTGEQPPREFFEQVWNAFTLSKNLDPENDEASGLLSKLAHFLRKIPLPDPPKQVSKADLDVLVVGAGASGIGCALILTETFGLDKKRVLLVEGGEDVGETFRRWPEEMRFISPSFNQQGWTNSFDLNAIAHGTSPAYSLHAEHPSGAEYAKYLTAIAKTNKMNIRRQTEVVSIRSISGDKELPLFSVDVCSMTGTETLTSRYVVWAAGEFQYPRAAAKDTKDIKARESEGEGGEKEEGKKGIVGSELCRHNSEVRSWARLPGDDFVIIGGYESGVDATYNLARAGKKCRLLASTPCWEGKTVDPSAELAPYTAARLHEVVSPGFSPKPELLAPLHVTRVERAESVGFNVIAKWKADGAAPDAKLRPVVGKKRDKEGITVHFHTPNTPILCTGFEGSVAAAANHLFHFADGSEKKGCLDGAPLLTKNDESTKVPGVFLVGPAVSHGMLSFCFIYKFRQRFAVVANAICKGLGRDTRAAVEECRKANMYLDDFSCCGDACGDVC